LSRQFIVKRRVFRLPRERRVADIIATARAEFEEKGHQDALLCDIAVRAEVVEGAIYRYFEYKHDLPAKVIEHWCEAMLSDYDRQRAGICGARNRLRFMIWRHLSTIRDDPALCHLAFRVLRTGSGYRATNIFERSRRYTRRMLDIVMEGVSAGELRPDVPLGLARDMIYGCVEHRTWAYLRGEGDFDPNKTADAIVDLVLGGLSGRTSGKRLSQARASLPGWNASLSGLKAGRSRSTERRRAGPLVGRE
jgi:AcrR family transcriptional regulator